MNWLPARLAHHERRACVRFFNPTPLTKPRAGQPPLRDRHKRANRSAIVFACISLNARAVQSRTENSAKMKNLVSAGHLAVLAVRKSIPENILRIPVNLGPAPVSGPFNHLATQFRHLATLLSPNNLAEPQIC